MLASAIEPPAETSSPPSPPAESEAPIRIDADDLDLDLSGRGHCPSESIGSPTVHIAAHDAEPFAEEIPPIDLGDGGAEFDPRDVDDEAAGFTLARGSAEMVEELDLAAMVDFAFQLVLFFLANATGVLYKILEIPPPNPKRHGARTVADA